MRGHVRTGPRAAALVVTVTVLLAVLFSLVGLPSPVLFAALLGGMLHALTSSTTLALPTWSFRIGQALIGIVIGAAVSKDALRQVLSDAPVIVVVTVATVAVSLAAGRILAIRRDVSVVTGTFALIAGGASGVVALARDLGADDRVVTVVQYLRVLIVLLTLPLVTTVVFRPPTGGTGPAGPEASALVDVVFVVLTLVVGLALARVLSAVPSATLLVPLLLAAVVSASGWWGVLSVPPWIQAIAYALIGLQVGLRFTRDSLRAITSMLPLVLALIVGVIATTALMGVALVWLTDVDPLTAYLATTPGGLFAVLAIATDSGSDATYVLALQVFRVIAILLITPLLARVLRDRHGPAAHGG